jgi:peroxiredoxin
LVVVGANPGGLGGAESAEQLQQFVEQTGVTFTIARDRSSTSYRTFANGGGSAISPFPLDVLIDAQGRIAYISREYEPAELEAVVESLLP